MKIYIASSWRNQHGVEMLTSILRQRGHIVLSWIEQCYENKNHTRVTEIGFSDWLRTRAGQQAFEYNTDAATSCDLLIYYAPAGKSACAEVGAAWACGVPVLGLFATGEDLGLMRLMVAKWFSRHIDLLTAINGYQKDLDNKELMLRENNLKSDE